LLLGTNDFLAQPIGTVGRRFSVQGSDRLQPVLVARCIGFDSSVPRVVVPVPPEPAWSTFSSKSIGRELFNRLGR
jgi:hypothetical protein